MLAKLKLPSILLLTLGIIIGSTLFIVTKITFDKTSETEFCISCHSMDNAYQDYKKSSHFSNKHGVKAECSDCHIPQQTMEYLVTKIRASKDIYHEFISGKIDTQQKYDSHKLAMAKTVWSQMEANDSATCRSCHDFEQMAPELQKQEAVIAHAGAKTNNQTCINCHKGIAHTLPKPKTNTISILDADINDQVYTTKIIQLHNSDQLEKSRAKVLPLTKLTIIKKQQDRVYVAITGWKEARKNVLYSEKGQRIASATLRGISNIDDLGENYQDPISLNPWKKIQIHGWLKETPIVTDVNPIWDNLKFAYDSKCGQCHLKVEEAHFSANDWPAQFMGMAKQAKLSKDETQAMLKYLQYHSSTFVKHN
ncbi:NapC/NirT family cytochrome c [Vibrio sp. 99-8-1]|uniref:NapC/NirT family cytochrome c n=1 Tax=Vibrio sp. 99-8-1 TaxID=2607602 RepID=UPI001493B1BA|nr:NapC/NirT family cytochrome c [Vibrio sp. 99-8-1]